VLTAALPLWFASCAFALALWQWLDLLLERETALLYLVLVPFDPRPEHAE
jgi:hypothetical protein